MSVMTHQVLQPTMGLRLAAEVRRSLVEMGNACNLAAVHLHQAMTNSMRIESVMEAQRANEHACELAHQVTGDLQRLADQHFEQAIIVLTRAATIYAVYASRVAAAVANNQTPPMPGSQPILPSDVITADGMYLPEVHFPDDGEPRISREQNATIAEARRLLTDLIAYRMQGEPAASYDDIAIVAAEDGGGHRLVEFASALHHYASVLVWALGLFSGVGSDDTSQ